LHANSAHDFVQQLAHHHGDFMRITWRCSFDDYIHCGLYVV
jgi:hypothetical protein